MKPKKHFDKATEARRAARMHAAKPGATRKIEDKRDKAQDDYDDERIANDEEGGDLETD
jgi:hypothetical protein